MRKTDRIRWAIMLIEAAATAACALAIGLGEFTPATNAALALMCFANGINVARQGANP